MGLVARQSFKAAIATYLGLGMGVLNNLFIYPYMLSVEQYGELQFVIQTASFFTPFLLFGLGAVISKYYPVFKEKEDMLARFHGLLLSAATLNVLLFLGLFLLFKDRVLSFYQNGSGVSETAVYTLIGISLILPYINLSRKFNANVGKIAIPSFLVQLLKFVLPLFIVIYYFGYFDFEDLFLALFLYYIFLLLVFIWYSNNQRKIRLSLDIPHWKQEPHFKAMMAFAAFSVISGIGGSLTNQIDILMITSMKGTYQNGLYAWSLFIANAIAVPFTLIAAIGVPVIAQYWKSKDLGGLAKIYRQSSEVSLLISIGIFLGFWLVVKDIFAIMPKGDEYILGINVVWMLCLAKIIDMSAGLNNEILSMSSRYKVLLWFLLIAVVLNVGLNYLLIPKYGIEGSSVATIIAILTYNLLKLIYIKRTFNLQPFRWNALLIVLLALLVYFGVSFLPRTSQHWLNILLYSSVFGLVYFGLAYLTKLSADFNEFIAEQWLKLRSGNKGV